MKKSVIEKTTAKFSRIGRDIAISKAGIEVLTKGFGDSFWRNDSLSIDW